MNFLYQSPQVSKLSEISLKSSSILGRQNSGYSVNKFVRKNKKPFHHSNRIFELIWVCANFKFPGLKCFQGDFWSIPGLLPEQCFSLTSYNFEAFICTILEYFFPQIRKLGFQFSDSFVYSSVRWENKKCSYSFSFQKLVTFILPFVSFDFRTIHGA